MEEAEGRFRPGLMAEAVVGCFGAQKTTQTLRCILYIYIYTYVYLCIHILFFTIIIITNIISITTAIIVLYMYVNTYLVYSM